MDQIAGARHVYAVIIARRKVQVGEATVVKLVSEHGIAAQQFRHCISVTFGLDDVGIVDGTEFADSAIDWRDEVRICQWSAPGLQCPGEEVVEARIARDIRGQGLLHVHAVFLDEPSDKSRRVRPGSRPGDATSELGDDALGNEILHEGIVALRHTKPPLAPNLFLRSLAGYTVGDDCRGLSFFKSAGRVPKTPPCTPPPKFTNAKREDRPCGAHGSGIRSRARGIWLNAHRAICVPG